MNGKGIAEIFRSIAEMLELKGDNLFRIRAYERAAERMEDLEGSLESIVVEGKLRSIPGIGSDLEGKIKEIIATGSLGYYEKLKKSIPQGQIDMLQIQGLGPKTVKSICGQLKIETVEELREAALESRLQKLEGIKAKIESNILRGIEFLDKAKERIPLYLALEIADSFIKPLKGMEEVSGVEIVGSLRRKKETIRDIDILAISCKPTLVINRFVSLPVVKEVLSKGKTKTSIIARQTRIQVDLRVVDEKNFGSAFMYFTGSKEFNIKLSQLAIRRGYRINEYGLISVGKGADKIIASKTEKSIFSLMKLKYIAPELREDRGEVEAASDAKLPKLLELSDIKGDLHVHSNYSDGEDTIEEMAQAAKARGYKYLGISDHSQSLKIARGLSSKELYKKIEEIRKVNKKLKHIVLLSGAEVDILKDGSLDYPDNVLKELDFVIAAIHNGFKQSSGQLTKRIVLACKNKYVNIIAHPTGILHGIRDPYEVFLNDIYKAASDYRVALEVNCYPNRLDLNDGNAMAAKRQGAKIALGSDSHRIEDLKFMSFGVGVSRRGWLEKDDVLNCMSLSQLLKWVKK